LQSTVTPLKSGPFAYVKRDLPASFVVFLVALPLCLGIAVASGAPPLAGLITGIIGGVVVAWASGSQLAVSGPAAGLTVIVLAAIGDLGYGAFLLAVVLAGGIQILLGLLRAGILALYVPSAVIKGMLAAIGIILILKQLPHAIGWDADYEGDFAFWQSDSRNTFTEIGAALSHLGWPALLISGIGLAALFAADKSSFLKKKMPWFPPPLIAVLVGVAINQILVVSAPEHALVGDHLVSIPTGGVTELWGGLSTPEWGRIADIGVWKTAGTLAIVASIETLLCVEAMDKLDPHKRQTPASRELLAQGAGNAIAGLLGGLPMTAVIVRGSANVNSGAQTRLSSFFHGVWLLVAVLLAAQVLNLIPLAALAAVLLHVGYKLASPAMMKAMFKQPASQWVPFVITIAAILVTDLLIGVLIGMTVGIFMILRAHLDSAFFVDRVERTSEADHQKVRLELTPNVSFLHRASVSKTLHAQSPGSIVEIDATRTRHVHPDIVELIREFEETAPERNIRVVLHGRETLETAAGLRKPTPRRGAESEDLVKS
jgi:MFS superfamily sulfate permease-like transporter